MQLVRRPDKSPRQSSPVSPRHRQPQNVPVMPSTPSHRDGPLALKLPTVLQPWSSAAWDSWSLDDETNLGLRLAYGGALIPNQDQRLGSNAGFGADLRIPWGFSLHDSWYLMHDRPSRERLTASCVR